VLLEVVVPGEVRGARQLAHSIIASDYKLRPPQKLREPVNYIYSKLRAEFEVCRLNARRILP
jgi:hypothetical protein